VKKGDGGGARSLFFGPVVERKRQKNGGRRRRCVVKKSKLTPAPYLYRGTRVVGVVVSAPLPRPFLREVATWRHGVGRRFL
jgi:hypothetical protein